MRIRPIICWRDVLDAIGVSRELITLPKSNALRIVRIVDGDRLTAVFLHDREAGDVSRPIADVNHVWEGNWANVRVHVVINILRHIEQTLVNSKEELRLLRVADDALWESDPAFFVFGEFAAENSPHIRL